MIFADAAHCFLFRLLQEGCSDSNSSQWLRNKHYVDEQRTQSDLAQSPPMSSSVVGSFNSTASVRAVALPTAASLNLSSGTHIFWNVSDGGLSVSSYFGNILQTAPQLTG